MANVQTNRVIISLVVALSVSQLGADCMATRDGKTPLGTLRLEGKSVECLKLRRAKGGQIEEFRRPGDGIELPMGEYRVQEVHLEGGYVYHASRGPGRHEGPVEVGKQATLTVGLPLRHTIEVERRGRLLTLDYALLGAGGEQYTGGDRSNPPRFKIYKGDREIASGQFEFG